MLLLTTVQLLDAAKKVLHADPEHFIENSLIIELNDHQFNFLQSGHLDADAHHYLVKIFRVIVGSLEDSARCLLGKHSAAERGHSVVYGASPCTFTEENLVNVQLLLIV